MLSKDRLLAAVPTETPGQYRYVLVDGTGGVPRILEAAADAGDDVGLQAMGAALHERYSGELRLN